jgi:hypothetical protein
MSDGKSQTSKLTVTVERPEPLKRGTPGLCQFETEGLICWLPEGHPGTKHVMVPVA